MKTISCFLPIALALFLQSVLANPPFPRPAFLPSTPAVTKAVSAYTAADVFGVIITDELPAGHPYEAGAKYSSGVKADWPGAKIATSIDALVQIVLDAPANANLDDAWDNLRYIFRKVMDVSEAEKTDALVRIVTAQTDPMKKARAADFASSMFDELLDPRLLAYLKDQLDNPAVVSILTREERPSITFTAMGEALRIIPGKMKAIGFTPASLPTRTTDEATSCAALKTWMTANWAEITTKCAAAKANPNRKLPGVNVSPWDARW